MNIVSHKLYYVNLHPVFSRFNDLKITPILLLPLMKVIRLWLFNQFNGVSHSPSLFYKARDIY